MRRSSNISLISNSSLSLELKLSEYSFSHGNPDAIQSVLTARFSSHSGKVVAINSGPLSDLMHSDGVCEEQFDSRVQDIVGVQPSLDADRKNPVFKANARKILYVITSKNRAIPGNCLLPETFRIGSVRAAIMRP